MPIPSIDPAALSLVDALDLAILIEEEAQERYTEFTAQMEQHRTPDALDRDGCSEQVAAAGQVRPEHPRQFHWRTGFHVIDELTIQGVAQEQQRLVAPRPRRQLGPQAVKEAG